MSLIDLGGVFVAIIAALGAWASARSSARASRINTEVSGRLEAEKGAYERARIFDTETIRRQDEEIAELRNDNDRLRRELAQVKRRLRRLEDISPDIERILREHIEDYDDQQ